MTQRHGFPGRLHLSDRVGLILTAALVALGLWTSTARAGADHQRIVSIGGSVTEIVYALGEERRIVARDSTSLYPEAALELPDVGYVRGLSPEGVLSVRPDMIIAEADAGPEDAVELLKSTDLPIVLVPEQYSADGIVTKIEVVGDALGVPEKAAALAAQVRADLDAVAREIAAMGQPAKRVLFILSTQGGRIMASGTGTSADAMIALAGGENAMDDFDGYKPVTAEAIAGAAPDVILMMDRRGGHSSSDQELFAMPALSTTPAAASGSVVRMNGLLLLGFGPRTAQAVRDLNTELYWTN